MTVRRNLILIVLFVLAVLAFTLHPAYADTTVFDYSQDFRAYAQMAAELNKEQTDSQTIRPEGRKRPQPFRFILRLLCQPKLRSHLMAFEFVLLEGRELT